MTELGCQGWKFWWSPGSLTRSCHHLLRIASPEQDMANSLALSWSSASALPYPTLLEARDGQVARPELRLHPRC